ncbi:unnamed protein product [Penicillium bialowiezense]
MRLLMLPAELLLSIPKFLKNEKDVSSLSRSSTRLHIILTPWLYRYNSRHNESSSILWATETGSEATARLSIQEGGDLGIRDDSGRSLLSRAAYYGHEEVVKALLETGRVDIESRDIYGRTALFWAAANGHHTVVKLLIEASADTRSRDIVGWTVLFWPAAYGHTSVVKLILATETVDVDSKDAEGRTPLYMAAAKGHEAVQEEVDLASKDCQGRSLSYWPTVNGYKAVEKLLIEAQTSHGNIDTVASTSQTEL